MKRWIYGGVCILAANLAGCGGGSGNIAATGGGGTRNVSVFVTDDVRTGYDKVWADVHKVEMTSSTGAKATLFEDAKGKTIDLRSLHDAQGSRFLFLANQNVPAGTYTDMKVTIGKKMTLFATGSATGNTVAVSPSLPVDGAGNPQVTVHLPTPVAVDNNSAKIVVDFDLSKFDISGGQVTPVVKKGDDAHIGDVARHEFEDIKGVVSGLTGSGANRQFTLDLPSGTHIAVATDSSSTLFFQSAASNPVLANGQRAEVRGLVDPATNTLKATDVKIEDVQENENESAEAKGTTADVDEAGGAFSIAVSEAEGFQPTAAKVRVVVNMATVFRSDSGVKLTAADFFSRIGASAFVKAEGAYDAGGNVLTASVVKIRRSGNNGGNGSGGSGSGGGGNGGGNGGAGDDSQGREAEAAGTLVNADAATGAFQLNPVSKFEGFSFAGGALAATTSDKTEFRGAHGKTSAADFFASLGGNAKVEVKGTYKDGVLSVLLVKLDN